MEIVRSVKYRLYPNSMIHELLHYLQEKSKNEYDYIPPKFDDCGLLAYIYIYIYIKLQN